MRLRPVLLVVLLLGVFWFTTTYTPLERFHPRSWVEPRPAAVTITEAAGPQELTAEENRNIEVYKKVLPSVVNITSTAVAFDFFYGAVPQEGQGSGFIINKDGYILTNYHVIANARQIEVNLADRRKFRATLVGHDRTHDLAVIRIAAPDLVPATLGDSRGLVVGQKVFAIGNPFGLAGTMTSGIISSIRSVRGPEGTGIEEAIQTDAAINPGNSGGPLLNARGEVIGINTFILSQVGQSAGIGFAIPINAAKAVLNDLVTVGRVRRPALGIRSIPVSSEIASEMGLSADYGVLIIDVQPGGAADRAGLRGGSERAYLGNMPIKLGGDLIVGINGKEIRDHQDIARMMNTLRAGDVITM